MELNPSSVYEILKSKGVDYLYHANSVQTSCTFLKNGSLLSRGVVQRRGLRQTEQSSDAIDQKYGIWFDIFTDSVDIHQRANRRNAYGPVLFKINIDILKSPNMPPLWITKKNPTKWIDGEQHINRWYISIEELNNQFIKGQFDQMIVFRHIGGVLPIRGFVTEIILDDPKQEYCGLNFYDFSTGALISAANEAGVTLTIYKRICNNYCSCVDEYKNNPSLVLKHFMP